MSTSEFPLYISHGQIAIFDPSLANPFNEWTDRHSAQGFTWRPGSVSFATLEEGGEHDVIFAIVSNFEEPPEVAARVIDVPFEVPPSGHVEVASIAQSVLVAVAPGPYQLRFETIQDDGETRSIIKLTLVATTSPVFALVRTDHASIDQVLLLDGSPA